MRHQRRGERLQRHALRPVDDRRRQILVGEPSDKRGKFSTQRHGGLPVLFKTGSPGESRDPLSNRSCGSAVDPGCRRECGGWGAAFARSASELALIPVMLAGTVPANMPGISASSLALLAKAA